MRWRYIGLLIVLYGIYLLVGSGVFVALEYTREEQECQRTIKEIEDTIRKVNSNLSGSEQVTGDDFIQLIRLIREAPQNGVQFDSNQNASCAHNWNFNKAFFFAGTVVTTIGYGNISPQTYGGRVFCILYAALGIPLFGIMFAALGDKFAKIFKKFDEKITTKAKSSLLRKLLVFLLATTSLSLLCCVIPAFIFVAVEKWHYYEAFYYSFITLTTIGFGDFVVGANADLTYPTVYNVAVYFWILFGLAYMAAVISISSAYMKETGKSNRRKVKQGEPDVIESGPDGIYNATDDIALPNGESMHNSFPQDGDEKPVTTSA